MYPRMGSAEEGMDCSVAPMSRVTVIAAVARRAPRTPTAATRALRLLAGAGVIGGALGGVVGSMPLSYPALRDVGAGPASVSHR